MIFSLVVIIAVFAVMARAYTDEAKADQILNLPGADKLNFNFNQFSGYLAIDGVKTGSKKMHYWMVESMNNPATDPIAFWTNGGPGCSGLLGFLTEQGPFATNNKDLSLALNPYAWNQRTNMVFIEQPCGVGFSYSTEGDDAKSNEDLHNNDAGAAKDNFALIQAFMSRFPEHAKSPLFITAESYGGHYMPTLAQEIVNRNSAGADPLLNFKGFAVGNPATTVWSTTPASLDTFWGHQLISKPLWDLYEKDCKQARLPNITLCETYFTAMYLQVGKNLNPYALDYPVCVEDSPAKYGRNQRNWLLRHSVQSEEVKKAIGLEPEASYEPCADDYLTSYLNRADVKSAIHVRSDIEWADCSRTLRYDQKDGSTSMVPIYQYLINGGYNLDILVFSGDDDSVCSTVGTQSWIWDMGYKTTGKPWVPYIVNQQTAGYLTKWADNKFSFLTIHGAGHEVPSYKPEAALQMWNDYIDGKLTSK